MICHNLIIILFYHNISETLITYLTILILYLHIILTIILENYIH